MTTYRPQSLCGKRRGSGGAKADLRRAWIAGYNAALRMLTRKPTHGALLEAWKAGRAEEREAQGGKMSDLPEAVKAAEAIHGDCQCRNRCHVKDHTGTVQVCVPCKDEIAEVAAIISSAFAPLVEERDRMSAACNSLERIGNKAADYCNQIADQLDQLQAKLDAVVKAGEAAVNAYPHLVDLEEALRKAKE